MDNERKFKKLDFCEIFHNGRKRKLPFNDQLASCVAEIELKYKRRLTNEGNIQILKTLRSLNTLYGRYLEQYSRGHDKVIKYRSSWVNEEVPIPETYFNLQNMESTFEESDYEPQPSTSTGITHDRSFSDYSERQQRNIVRGLADTIKDPEAALRTARILAKEKGDKVLAKLITETINLNKTNENEEKSSGLSRVDPDRYLAHMIYTGMTKKGHRDQMQMLNNENGTKVVPGYEKILEAKKRCYPKGIEVTHKKASIPLKELLYTSIQRLYQAHKDDIEEAASKIPSNNEYYLNTEMLVMWGMDGTTGQAQYNQANSKEDGEVMNDSSLMTVTMTMLKLIHKEGEGDEEKITTIWENESTQSTHSCRPIQLEFEKESEEYVKKTKKHIDEQIEDLPTHLLKMHNGQDLAISYRFYFTMIDGKVLNVTTGTRSAQRCPICGATPTQMKDIEMIGKFKPKENVLEYGIQPMHSTMNTIKNLYKISYREGINKHQIRAEADKTKFKATKKKVQERMRDAFHVRIDEPRAGGAGTSDTAAVARKLLKEPEKLAETLHLDKEVVKRISVVMNAICCGEKLDPKKFGDYCQETYKKYLSVYSWYPPCASLHKVLEHSKDVIITLPMALGKMAEEGGESQNKLLVIDREHHSRKTSRIDTLTDMIHGRLIHSDPVISQKYLKSQPRKVKRIEDLSPEVQQLLLMPNGGENNDEEYDDVYMDGQNERNFFSLLMDEEENIFWGEDFESDEDNDEDYVQSENEDSDWSEEAEENEN